MPISMRIDFVSDVACPWCAVGLASLQQALKNSADAVQATLHFQPFELNPDMGPEGEDIGEHLGRVRKALRVPGEHAVAVHVVNIEPERVAEIVDFGEVVWRRVSNSLHA